MKRPVVLIILDGWGIAAEGPGNAITLGKVPNIDRLWNSYPHTKLQASGEAVGLPRGEAGNTETGHLNIGAGQIVYQDLPRINMAIADGSFYKNKGILAAINHARTNQSKLHIMGLIGAGGVHANNEHLYALLFLCKEQRFSNVFIHLFTDGRDSPPTVAAEYVKKVQEELKLVGFGAIASVSGRYYAMDRDTRWERTGKTYHALTTGNCPHATSPEEIVKKSYEKGITDEFIEPTVMVDASDKPLALIGDNDACIFYNFRIDRPRQLTKAFVLNDLVAEMNALKKSPGTLSRAFSMFKSTPLAFKRERKLANLFFVTMTEYEKNLPVEIAFPPQPVKFPLGRVIADRGLQQLRLTESEKERFVTFYFNGHREAPFIGEDRIIIPSLKVPTYDLAPEMRAREIAQTLVEKLREDAYDLIIVNFPNADMVGHSGVIPAAVKGCEIIDECMGTVITELATKENSVMLITADHGNAEEMINPKTGGVDTEHSTYPVPLIVVSKEFEGKPRELRPGVLGDIAPTILGLMDIPAPIEMTGHNLLL